MSLQVILPQFPGSFSTLLLQYALDIKIIRLAIGILDLIWRAYIACCPILSSECYQKSPDTCAKPIHNHSVKKVIAPKFSIDSMYQKRLHVKNIGLSY